MLWGLTVVVSQTLTEYPLLFCLNLHGPKATTILGNLPLLLFASTSRAKGHNHSRKFTPLPFLISITKVASAHVYRITLLAQSPIKPPMFCGRGFHASAACPALLCDRSARMPKARSCTCGLFLRILPWLQRSYFYHFSFTRKPSPCNHTRPSCTGTKGHAGVPRIFTKLGDHCLQLCMCTSGCRNSVRTSKILPKPHQNSPTLHNYNNPIHKPILSNLKISQETNQTTNLYHQELS